MLTRSRFAKWIPLLVILVLVTATAAFARIGGGESFDSGNSSSDSGGDAGWIIDILVWLCIEHPQVGIPLTIMVIIGYVIWKKMNDGDSSTRKAIDKAEAERRTSVSATAVDGWVNALKAKDANFDLMKFFDRTRREFLELQDAWFKRNLEPVRKYLSDATFQRLVTQMKLMELMGVRDAIADARVLDLQIIGLEQNESFDTIHIRVTASLCDDDAPSNFTDEQALALARKKKPEQFVEVWTFVRKPGVVTKVEGDVSQGKCPNCGADFAGGAANTCEFCGAIVNSGTYDWVLAEITQGSQFQPHAMVPDGFAKLRQSDPSLTTEALEDRASLLFWKWVESQVYSDSSRLAKVAAAPFVAEVQGGIEHLQKQGKVKFFVECAVGGVNTQQLTQANGKDIAAVEIKWSAKIGIGPKGTKPPQLPSQPQRYVMLLERASGAKSSADNGMATNRCPQCGAPLTDNGQPTCEYCGTVLNSGERDWVIQDFGGWEWWKSKGGQPATAAAAPVARPSSAKMGNAARVPDKEERERLIFLMAAMAMADGVVDQKERQLLKMASDRWSVPWANVELALNAPANTMFNKLIVKGSSEAESFMRELVNVALADGKIDSREKKMLEAAAAHVGLQGRLGEFLK
ncbi:MAG: TIM44-like domain-containing protein [Archangium sp.]|nr:TIM44-like domain-containing protein [Archangium sp.]